MELLFGQQYRDYKTIVSRWLPFPFFSLRKT
jgi:protein-S-isoprenylcysteine O-methyltransferase Ste14